MNPKRSHFLVFSLVMLLVFSFLAVVSFGASYFYTCVATYGPESRIFCIDTLDDSRINQQTTLQQCEDVMLEKYTWIPDPNAVNILEGLKNQQPICTSGGDQYYVFEGTVVTVINGQEYPVPDALVQFKAGSLPYGNAITTNDAGYFSKLIHSSVNVIEISKTNMLPDYGGGLIAKEDSGKSFAMRQDITKDPVSVSGKVVDATGSPVSNALVSVAGKYRVATALSDSSGNYVLVLPDYSAVIIPHVLGFKLVNGVASTGKSLNDVTEAGPHDITLSTPATKKIFGKAILPPATGISDAVITLAIPGTNVIYSDTTDADGSYEIAAFPMVDGDATVDEMKVYVTKSGFSSYAYPFKRPGYDGGAMYKEGDNYVAHPDGSIERDIGMEEDSRLFTECVPGQGSFSGKVTPWSACQRSCYDTFICDAGQCSFFNPLPDNSQHEGFCENPSVCRYNPPSTPLAYCARQSDPLCEPPLDENGKEKCFTDTNNVCTRESVDGPYFLKNYNLLVPEQYEEYCGAAGRCPQDPECSACAGMDALCGYRDPRTAFVCMQDSPPDEGYSKVELVKSGSKMYTVLDGVEKTPEYCQQCLFYDKTVSPWKNTPVCDSTCEGAGYTCCSAENSQESAPLWVQNTCGSDEVCSASCGVSGYDCTDSNKWLCPLYGGTLTQDPVSSSIWHCDIPVCNEAAIPECPRQDWGTDSSYWATPQFYESLSQYSYTAGDKTYEVKNPYVAGLSCSCGASDSVFLGTNILNETNALQSGSGPGASCCIEGLQVHVDDIRDYVPEGMFLCQDFDMDGLAATNADLAFCKTFESKYVLYPNSFDMSCDDLFKTSPALAARCKAKLGKDGVRHLGQLMAWGGQNELDSCVMSAKMDGVSCSPGDFGDFNAAGNWVRIGNVLLRTYGGNLNDGLLSPSFSHAPTACLPRGTLSGTVVGPDGTLVASGFVAYGEPQLKADKYSSKKTVTYDLSDNYEDSLGTFVFRNAPLTQNYQYQLSAFNLLGDRGASNIIPSQYTVENNAIGNIVIQLGQQQSRDISIAGIVYYLPPGESLDDVTGQFTLIELEVVSLIIGQLVELLDKITYGVLSHGGRFLPGVVVTLVEHYSSLTGEECSMVAYPPFGLFAFPPSCNVPEGAVMMLSAHDTQGRAKDYFGFFTADRNINASSNLHIERVRMEFYYPYTITGNVYDLFDGQLDSHGNVLKKPSKKELLRDEDGNPLPFTVYYKARGKVSRYNIPAGGLDGRGQFILDESTEAVVGQGKPLECDGNGQCYIWADAFGYAASKPREITLKSDIVLDDPFYLEKTSCGLNPDAPTLLSVDNVVGQKAIEIKWKNDCPVRYFYVYRCDILSGTGSTCSALSDFEPVSDALVPTTPDQESFTFRDKNFLPSSLELQEPVGNATEPQPIAHENRYTYYIQAVYKYPFVRTLESDQMEVTGGYEECMKGAMAFCGATPYWKHFEFRCGIGESERTPKNIIYSFGDNVPGQLTQDIPGDAHPGRNCGSLICIKQPGSEPDRLVYGSNGEPVYPTTCIPQEPCEECNVPFGAFAPSLREPYAGQTCADTMSCVLDYSESNFDKYEKCENVLSCYDYRSKDACGENKCLPEDCMWDTTVYDFLSIGVCRPVNRNMQQCAQCDTFDSNDFTNVRSPQYAEGYKDFETSQNAIFSSCDSHVCTRFGDHRPLTQYDVCGYTEASGCMDQVDMACEDYGRDINACLGVGSEQRESRFDNYRNYHGQLSNDRFGIGVCRYLYSPYGCAKDTDVVGSDFNGIGSGFLGTPDCMFYTGEEKRICELDRQPPYSYTDNIGAYNDNMNIRFFSHDEETDVTGTYVEVCDSENLQADPLKRCRAYYYSGSYPSTENLSLSNLYEHSKEHYTGETFASERDYTIDYYARDRYSNLMLSKRVEFRFDNNAPLIKDQNEDMDGLNLLTSVTPVCEQELLCEQECGGSCTPECPNQGIYQQAMAACYGIDSQGNFNQNLLVGPWKASAKARIEIENWDDEEVVACKAVLMKDGQMVGTFGPDTVQLEDFITHEKAKVSDGMVWDLSFTGLEDGQEYCLNYYCLDNVMNVNGNPEFSENINSDFLKSHHYFDHDYEDASKLQSQLPSEEWYGTECRKIYADPSVIIYKPNPQYGNRDKFFEDRVDFEVLTLADDLQCKFNLQDLDGNRLISQEEFMATGIDLANSGRKTVNGKEYTSHTYDDFIIYSQSQNEKFIFPVRCMLADTKKIIGHGLNIEFVYDKVAPETQIMTNAEVTIRDMAGSTGWITESMANELKFFCRDPQVSLPEGARRSQPLEFGCYGTVYCAGFNCQPGLTDMQPGTPLDVPKPTGPMNYCYFSADKSYLLGGPNIEETKCEFIPVDKWAPILGDAKFTNDMPGFSEIQPKITDNHTVYFHGMLKNPVIAEFATGDLSFRYPYTFTRYQIQADFIPTVPEDMYSRVPLIYFAATKDSYYALVYTQISAVKGRLEIMQGNYNAEETKVAEQFYKLNAGGTYHLSVDAGNSFAVTVTDVTDAANSVQFTSVFREPSTMGGVGIYLLDSNTFINKSQRQGYAAQEQYGVAFSDLQVYNTDQSLQLPGRANNKMQSDILSYVVETQKPSSFEDPYPQRELVKLNGTDLKLVQGIKTDNPAVNPDDTCVNDVRICPDGSLDKRKLFIIPGLRGGQLKFCIFTACVTEQEVYVNPAGYEDYLPINTLSDMPITIPLTFEDDRLGYHKLFVTLEDEVNTKEYEYQIYHDVVGPDHYTTTVKDREAAGNGSAALGANEITLGKDFVVETTVEDSKGTALFKSYDADYQLTLPFNYDTVYLQINNFGNLWPNPSFHDLSLTEGRPRYTIDTAKGADDTTSLKLSTGVADDDRSSQAVFVLDLTPASGPQDYVFSGYLDVSQTAGVSDPVSASITFEFFDDKGQKMIDETQNYRIDYVNLGTGSGFRSFALTIEKPWSAVAGVRVTLKADPNDVDNNTTLSVYLDNLYFSQPDLNAKPAVIPNKFNLTLMDKTAIARLPYPSDVDYQKTMQSRRNPAYPGLLIYDYPPGRYLFTLVMFDRYGQLTTKSIFVNVKDTVPPELKVYIQLPKGYPGELQQPATPLKILLDRIFTENLTQNPLKYTINATTNEPLLQKDFDLTFAYTDQFGNKKSYPVHMTEKSPEDGLYTDFISGRFTPDDYYPLEFVFDEVVSYSFEAGGQQHLLEYRFSCDPDFCSGIRLDGVDITLYPDEYLNISGLRLHVVSIQHDSPPLVLAIGPIIEPSYIDLSANEFRGIKPEAPALFSATATDWAGNAIDKNIANDYGFYIYTFVSELPVIYYPPTAPEPDSTPDNKVIYLNSLNFTLGGLNQPPSADSMVKISVLDSQTAVPQYLDETTSATDLTSAQPPYVGEGFIYENVFKGDNVTTVEYSGTIQVGQLLSFTEKDSSIIPDMERYFRVVKVQQLPAGPGRQKVEFTPRLTKPLRGNKNGAVDYQIFKVYAGTPTIDGPLGWFEPHLSMPFGIDSFNRTHPDYYAYPYGVDKYGRTSDFDIRLGHYSYMRHLYFDLDKPYLGEIYPAPNTAKGLEINKVEFHILDDASGIYMEDIAVVLEKDKGKPSELTATYVCDNKLLDCKGNPNNRLVVLKDSSLFRNGVLGIGLYNFTVHALDKAGNSLSTDGTNITSWLLEIINGPHTPSFDVVDSNYYSNLTEDGSNRPLGYDQLGIWYADHNAITAEVNYDHPDDIGRDIRIEAVHLVSLDNGEYADADITCPDSATGSCIGYEMVGGTKFAVNFAQPLEEGRWLFTLLAVKLDLNGEPVYPETEGLIVGNTFSIVIDTQVPQVDVEVPAEYPHGDLKKMYDMDGSYEEQLTSVVETQEYGTYPESLYSVTVGGSKQNQLLGNPLKGYYSQLFGDGSFSAPVRLYAFLINEDPWYRELNLTFEDRAGNVAKSQTKVLYDHKSPAVSVSGLLNLNKLSVHVVKINPSSIGPGGTVIAKLNGELVTLTTGLDYPLGTLRVRIVDIAADGSSVDLLFIEESGSTVSRTMVPDERQIIQLENNYGTQAFDVTGGWENTPGTLQVDILASDLFSFPSGAPSSFCEGGLSVCSEDNLPLNSGLKEIRICKQENASPTSSGACPTLNGQTLWLTREPYGWSSPANILGTFEAAFLRPYGLDQETYEVYRIEAEDWSGRITSAVYTIKYDITPPVTSYDYSHHGVWYNKNALITLKANDSFSGVAATYYCTYAEGNVTCTDYKKYQEPVFVIDEGITYFRFYSVDNAGNEEVAQEIKIMLDKTLPILDEPVSVLSAHDLFVWKDPLTKVWYTGDDTVHVLGKYRELHPSQVFRKQANQQGFDTFELLEDNFFLLKNLALNDGMNLIDVAMTDLANNTGLLPTQKVVSDRKGPNITMVSSQYLNTEVPVLRIATDEYATCTFIPAPGSDEEQFAMAPDTDFDYGPEVGGLLTSRHWQFEVGGDVPPFASGQVYDVKFSCQDMFGNMADATFMIVIDTTPPQLRITPVWTDNLIEDPYFDSSLDYAYQLTAVSKMTKKLQGKFDIEDWNFFDYSQDITCTYTLDSPFKVMEKGQVLGTKAFAERQTFTTAAFLHGYMDEYRYTISCTDRAGNLGETYLYLIVNTKKDFKIIHTSPATGDFLTQNTDVPLEVTTNFAVDDAKGCDYRNGTVGENWISMSRVASNTYATTLSGPLGEAFHTYTTRCFPYNIDMLKDDAFITFGVDTTPSTILLSPDLSKAADHVLTYSWRVNAQAADAPIDHYVYWLNTSTDIIGKVYEGKTASKTYQALSDGYYTFNVYGVTTTGLLTPTQTSDYLMTTALGGWQIIDALDNLQVLTFTGEQIMPVDGVYYTKYDKLRVTGKTQTTNVTFMYQRYTPNKIRLADPQQREFDLYPIQLFEEGLNKVELVGADVNLKIILHAELNISLDSTPPSLTLVAPLDGFTNTATPEVTIHSTEALNVCYLTYPDSNGLKKQVEMSLSSDMMNASVVIPADDPLQHDENGIRRLQIQIVCLDQFLNHNMESNQNFVLTVDQSDIVVGLSESVNGLLRKESFIENALATYDVIRGRNPPPTTYTHLIAHASKPVQCQYAGGTTPPDLGMQYDDAGNNDFGSLYRRGYFLKPRSQDLLLDDASLYSYGTICRDHAGNLMTYPFLTTLDVNLTDRIKVFDIMPQPFTNDSTPIATAYTDVAASCTISQYVPGQNQGFLGFLKGLLEGLGNYFRKQANMNGERQQLYKHSALISESATQSQRALQDYGTYWFRINCVELYAGSGLAKSEDYIFNFTVDTIPPGVIIVSPASYEEFTQSETEIRVNVNERYPEKIAVYVNGELFEERMFADLTDADFYLGGMNTSGITHTYNLKLPVYLETGENVISVVVTDKAGNHNGDGETAYYIFNNPGPSITYLFPNRPAVLPSLDAVQLYAMPNFDSEQAISSSLSSVKIMRMESDNTVTEIPIRYDSYLTSGVERFEMLIMYENITNTTNLSMTDGYYRLVAEVRDVTDVAGEKALAFITVKDGVPSFVQTVPAKVKATVRADGFTIRGIPSYTTPWLAQHIVLNNEEKPGNIKRVPSGTDVTYTIKLVGGPNDYYYRLVDLDGVKGQTGTYDVVRDDNAPEATVCIGAYDYESLAACLDEHHITVDELAEWLGLPQGMTLEEFVDAWLG